MKILGQFKLANSNQLKKYLKEIDKNKYYSNFGPLYFKLKKNFENRFNYENNEVILTSNGHSSLLAITKYLRSTTNKNYVICPSYSFYSNPLSIVDAGFKPIFVDINEKDLILDLDLTQKILKKNKDIAFIMIVSPFGNKISISKLNYLRNKFKLPIVYDAADNFLNLDKNIVNNKVLISVSFHPTKTLGGNESGMILTPSNHAKHIKKLINFGEQEYIGFNGKFSEYDAAILLANYNQLRKREKKLKSIHRILKKTLNHKYIFKDSNNNKSNKFMFYSTIKKSKIEECLSKFNIKIFNLWSTKSMHELKMFRKYKKTKMKVTNKIKRNLYTFFLNENFSLKKFNDICSKLNNLK